MQAAVAAAAGAALRRLAPDGQAAPQRMADRVFALCRWRDRLARAQDESAWCPFALLCRLWIPFLA